MGKSFQTILEALWFIIYLFIFFREKEPYPFTKLHYLQNFKWFKLPYYEFDVQVCFIWNLFLAGHVEVRHQMQQTIKGNVNCSLVFC